MRRLVVAFVAAAVLLLGACSDPQPTAPDVMVSGAAGAAPTITYRTPLSVTDTVTEVIWPGTGPELAEGEPVLVDFWLENATDASVVKESYTSIPTPRVLSEEDLGRDLYKALSGQRVGARVLQISPAPGEGSADYPTVTVLDVLPTRAEGEAVPPREGLPAVTLAGDGAPSIAASEAAPPTDLVVQPLLRSTGAQVAEGDVITVQYTGFAWTTGTPFDSTWTSGTPVSFPLDSVPAWSEALVEQTVGSQVMIVVPPTYSLEATQSEELTGQTLVFVVDILATGPASDATAAEPGQATTTEPSDDPTAGEQG
ncbi:FKBP-type peptidyl-prolyl cis-trans isomerase [Cellulomonas hominis]